MLIGEAKRGEIINLDLIEVLYAGADGKIIAKETAGKMMPVATYNTDEAALEAVRILIERIEHAPSNAGIIRMPTEDEVMARLHQTEAYHHLTGKKTKSHGGS